MSKTDEKSDTIATMLQAFSKDALVALIVNHGIVVTERDIRRAQHEYLTAKAAAMSNEALAAMKRYDSVEHPALRREAERKFGRAMELYDRANALMS